MPSVCQFNEGNGSKCAKVANYGSEGVAVHCGDHRQPGDVNVRARMCESCDRQASFGYSFPIACSDHKSEDMNDLKHRTCAQEGCSKSPACGAYCAEHGSSPNTKHRSCVSCGKQASFGISKATHCGDHKTSDMINIKRACQEHREVNCDICFYRLNPGADRTVNHQYKLKMFSDMMQGAPSWFELKLDNSKPKDSTKLVIRLNVDSYKSNGKVVKGCFLEQPAKAISEGRAPKVNRKQVNARRDMCQEAYTAYDQAPDELVTIHLP